MGRRTGILIALASIVIGAMMAGPALAATKNVKLTADNKFVPGTATIAVGDTVKFVWEGGFHDVKFSDGKASGAPTADAGTTYSRTFDAAGTYSYICSVHESVGMKGSITVQAAASGGGDTTSTTAGGTTGTTDPTAMPMTGPEDSALPLLGIGLVGIGAAVLLWRRPRRE